MRMRRDVLSAYQVYSAVMCRMYATLHEPKEANAARVGEAAGNLLVRVRDVCRPVWLGTGNVKYVK